MESIVAKMGQNVIGAGTRHLPSHPKALLLGSICFLVVVTGNTKQSEIPLKDRFTKKANKLNKYTNVINNAQNAETSQVFTI